MRHKRNLPTCLLSGLGTATVLLAGCLNSQTSRDGLLTPLWPTNPAPLTKSSTTSSGGTTATLSDANAVATTSAITSSPAPRPVVRRKVTQSKTSTSLDSTTSSESSGADSSSAVAASPSPAPTAAESPDSQPDTETATPSTDGGAVQLASAEAPVPATDSTSESTSESTSDSTTNSSSETASLPASGSSTNENPSEQPEGSRLSDFVAPNRVAPLPTTEPDGSASLPGMAGDASTTAGVGTPTDGPRPNTSPNGDSLTTFTSFTEGETESGDLTFQEGTSEGPNGLPLSSSERLARNVPSTSKGQESPEMDHDSWEEHLEQSIEGLRQRLATADLDERERARLEGILRLMYIAANRQEDALASLDQLSPQQQKFWRSGVAGLLELLSPPSDSSVSRQAKQALRHLRSACHELAVMASLEVRNLAFCRRVESFGRYTEFEPYEFFPEQEVILYAEVGNFVVEEVADGYESELLGSYQIFDESGRHIGDYDLPLDKQVSRHIRTDYFLPYRVYLPRALAEGNYTIQVTMQDKKGKKFGQTEPVRFRIRHE